MDVVAFLVVLAMLTAYVAAPLYRTPPDVPSPGRTDLQARQDALVDALRELELDHAAGGVDSLDYAQQRHDLEAEAASVMRTLEES